LHVVGFISEYTYDARTPERLRKNGHIKFIEKRFASHAYWMNGFGGQAKTLHGVGAATLFCRHNAYKIWHYHSSDIEDLSCLGRDTVDRQAVSDTL